MDLVGKYSASTYGFRYSHISSGWISLWKGGRSSVTLKGNKKVQSTLVCFPPAPRDLGRACSAAGTLLPGPCNRVSGPGARSVSRLQEGREQCDPQAQFGPEGLRCLPHPSHAAAAQPRRALTWQPLRRAREAGPGGRVSAAVSARWWALGELQTGEALGLLTRPGQRQLGVFSDHLARGMEG